MLLLSLGGNVFIANGVFFAVNATWVTLLIVSRDMRMLSRSYKTIVIVVVI